MTRRLRLQSVTIQPVLVWDDGEELTPGPELGAVSLPLSRLDHFRDSIPAEIAALQAKLEEPEAPDGN